MRQAQARKISDAYLHAPKRSERHLHAVEEAATAVAEVPVQPDAPAPVAEAERAPAAEWVADAVRSPARHRVADAVRSPAPERVVEDLRIEAPAVEIPDWAEPFADARWDDRLGYPDYEERDGRRTVLVTGRPEGKAVPRRDSTPSARMRRQTPTRARLAGRPDRVALWAVGLGLLMAAIAGFSGNGGGHSSHGAAEPAPAPLSSR
jgi:hypothetical protein